MRSAVKRFHLGTQRCLYLGSPSEDIKESVEEERSAEAERLYYVALTRAQARLLLPCFVVDSNTKKGPKPSHPGGNYKILNRRLREILEKDERSDLFQVLDVPNKVLQVCAREGAVNLSNWVLPHFITSDLPNYQVIRRAARPPFTTSYSFLHDFIKSRKGKDQDEEMVLDGEQEGSVVVLGPDELPRGAKTGIFLHQLLEEVDLQSAEGVSFEVWWADAQRRTWVTKALESYGIKGGYSKRAGRMVFDAIRAPLGSAPLSCHDHVLRELGFLARYLDTEDLFQGAMDVIFEREGKIHLLDWKSDALPVYDFAALDARVRSDYLIQIKIYLNIVLAYFNIEDEISYEARFGDLHYVFLRGLPGEGVWSWHPAWSDVLTWRQDLSQLHEKVMNV
jgi:exodeoxyribonuclease V beta subunit